MEVEIDVAEELAHMFHHARDLMEPMLDASNIKVRPISPTHPSIPPFLPCSPGIPLSCRLVPLVTLVSPCVALLSG